MALTSISLVSRICISESLVAMCSLTTHQALLTMGSARMLAATTAPHGGGCECIALAILLSCDSILLFSPTLLATTDNNVGLSEYNPMDCGSVRWVSDCRILFRQQTHRVKALRQQQRHALVRHET